MNLLSFSGQLVYAVLVLFFFIFVLFNLVEKEYRALRRSLAVFLFLVILPVLFYLFLSSTLVLFFVVILILIIIFMLIIFLSPTPKGQLQIVSDQARIDERDIIFARFDLKENSPEYNAYYQNRPEYKAGDDQIRQLPDLFEPQHIQKDPVLMSLGDAEFEFLEHQMTIVNGEIGREKIIRSEEDNNHMIRSILRYLGSDDCGICRLDSSDVYSHVGRGPEKYGSEVKNTHKYGISFIIKMDFDMIRHAPRPPVIVETAKQYVEAAKISVILAAFIRRLGYSARANIAGSNYQTLMVPCAWKAGLGEMGRMGILIHPRFGPSIRIGLVTTDLPLITNKPIVFGVQDFCKKCQKCANNCPAEAVPKGDKIKENGVLKWVIKREKCYKYWRKVGTDCSTCIFVCPYSKPDNLFHNMVRNLATNFSAAQSLFVWADDFFYGKKPDIRKKPHPFQK